MPSPADKTVREIALENPASVAVFESLGIDYCCGGKRPLGEACTRAGADVNHVMALLADAAPDRDATEWRDQPLYRLTAHIVAVHHAFVRREGPRIGSLLAKVDAKHGAAHPEIAQIAELFAAINQEMTAHMMKEELMLFPCITRLEATAAEGQPPPPTPFGSLRQPIANMLADHDDAGALLARIRDLSHRYTPPAGACPTFAAAFHGLQEFEADMHLHVHLENNILFPRAVALEGATPTGRS